MFQVLSQRKTEQSSTLSFYSEGQESEPLISKPLWTHLLDFTPSHSLNQNGSLTRPTTRTEDPSLENRDPPRTDHPRCRNKSHPRRYGLIDCYTEYHPQHSVWLLRRIQHPEPRVPESRQRTPRPLALIDIYIPVSTHTRLRGWVGGFWRLWFRILSRQQSLQHG